MNVVDFVSRHGGDVRHVIDEQLKTVVDDLAHEEEEALASSAKRYHTLSRCVRPQAAQSRSGQVGVTVRPRIGPSPASGRTRARRAGPPRVRTQATSSIHGMTRPARRAPGRRARFAARRRARPWPRCVAGQEAGDRGERRPLTSGGALPPQVAATPVVPSTRSLRSRGRPPAGSTTPAVAASSTRAKARGVPTNFSTPAAFGASRRPQPSSAMRTPRPGEMTYSANGSPIAAFTGARATVRRHRPEPVIEVELDSGAVLDAAGLATVGEEKRQEALEKLKTLQLEVCPAGCSCSAAHSRSPLPLLGHTGVAGQHHHVQVRLTARRYRPSRASVRPLTGGPSSPAPEGSPGPSTFPGPGVTR